MSDYQSYSSQRTTDLNLEPDMTLLTGETLSTDIRLVGGVFDLKLSVTSEQYNRLLSAAIEGAYAAYPDDYNNVIAPLILAGKRLATMTCDDIANCIETDADVQNAIVDSNNSTGTLEPDVMTDVINNYINQRFPEAQRNEPIAHEPYECDLDKLWTGILEIVTRLDEASRDAWQDITAQANKIDRIAEAVAIIPLIAEIPAETIESFAEVVPDLLAAYEAHSSSTVLEDIACDLFNMVCAECRYPTAQELYSYYATFGVTGIQDLLSYGVDAAIDFLIGSQTLANAVVFFTTNAIQLYFRYLGGTYLGKRGLKWLAIWADVGEDNPNNGWELLCAGGGCVNPIWCHTWDFTIDEQEWEKDTGQTVPLGVYSAGNGWTYEDVTNASYALRGMIIKNDLLATTSATLVEIRFEMDYLFGNQEPSAIQPMISLRKGSGDVIGGWTAPQAALPSFSGSPVTHTLTLDPPLFVTGLGVLRIDAYSSRDNVAPDEWSGNVVIRKLTIRGKGTKPNFVGGAAC